MSTSKDIRDYILEQYRNSEDITCRPMMGEYLLYYKGVLFGGIYDGKLLIKRSKSNETFNLEEIVPYKGAKPMYWIEDIEDYDRLIEITYATYLDFKK